MTKAERITALAEKTGETKATCEKIYNTAFEMIKDELAKGESVAVNGFGTFKVTSRSAREGRNPQTGEKIQIKASKSVGFKAGKELKAKVN